MDLTDDVVSGNPDEDFVQHCRKCKHHEPSRSLTPAPSDQRRVYMPLHELVHGLVPRSPIRAHGRAVPPLAVELSVAKPHELSQRVETGLEHGKEARKPDDQ